MGNCMACVNTNQELSSHPVYIEDLDAMDDLEFESLLAFQNDETTTIPQGPNPTSNNMSRSESSSRFTFFNRKKNIVHLPEEDIEQSAFDFEDDYMDNESQVELVRDEELQRISTLVDEQIKINMAKESSQNSTKSEELQLEEENNESKLANEVEGTQNLSQSSNKFYSFDEALKHQDQTSMECPNSPGLSDTTATESEIHPQND